MKTGTVHRLWFHSKHLFPGGLAVERARLCRSPKSLGATSISEHVSTSKELNEASVSYKIKTERSSPLKGRCIMKEQ